jgi:hypothetical protein
MDMDMDMDMDIIMGKGMKRLLKHNRRVVQSEFKYE